MSIFKLMHRHSLPRTAVLVFLVTLLSGCGSDWFGPEDYAECVLRGTGNESEVEAAAEVRRRCREQFPGSVKQQRARDLPSQAIENIRYEAELFFNQFLNGTVYNDNDDYVVTEVLIAVETIRDGEKLAHVYSEQVLVGPRRSDDFGLQIDTKDEIIGWHIASARGIEN